MPYKLSYKLASASMLSAILTSSCLGMEKISSQSDDSFKNIIKNENIEKETDNEKNKIEKNKENTIILCQLYFKEKRLDDLIILRIKIKKIISEIENEKNKIEWNIILKKSGNNIINLCKNKVTNEAYTIQANIYFEAENLTSLKNLLKKIEIEEEDKKYTQSPYAETFKKINKFIQILNKKIYLKEYNKKNYTNVCNLADIFYQEGKYDTALDYYLKIPKSQENKITENVLANMSLCYLTKSKKEILQEDKNNEKIEKYQERAKDLILEVLEKDKNIKYQYILFMLYVQQGNLEEAYKFGEILESEREQNIKNKSKEDQKKINKLHDDIKLILVKKALDKKNPEKYKEYMDVFLKNKNCSFMYALGIFCYKSDENYTILKKHFKGGEEQKEFGLRLITEAATLGDIKAKFNLSMIHYNLGTEEQQNHNKERNKFDKIKFQKNAHYHYKMAKKYCWDAACGPYANEEEDKEEAEEIKKVLIHKFYLNPYFKELFSEDENEIIKDFLKMKEEDENKFFNLAIKYENEEKYENVKLTLQNIIYTSRLLNIIDLAKNYKCKLNQYSVLEKLEKQNGLILYNFYSNDKNYQDVFKFGCSYIINNLKNKALEAFEKVIEYTNDINCKEKELSFINCAEIYFEKNDYENAIKNYELAFENSKENNDLHKSSLLITSRLGGIYSFIKNYSKAMSYTISSTLKSIKEKDNSFFVINMNYSKEIFLDQKDFENGIKFYELVVSEGRDSKFQEAVVSGLNQLGLLYLEQGETDKAIETYETSVKEGENIKDGQYTLALGYLGYIYESINKNERAINVFQQIIDLKNIDQRHVSKSYYNLGLVYAKMEKREEAIKSFEISIKEGCLLPYPASAFLYYELGDNIKTLEALNNGKNEIMLKIVILENDIKQYYNDLKNVFMGFYSKLKDQDTIQKRLEDASTELIEISDALKTIEQYLKKYNKKQTN